MKKLILISAILLITGAVQAGEIVAIVGDTPISSYDVKNRAALMTLQQPTFNAGKNNKKVLDILVDEQIKGQEATKQGFKASEEDIKNAMAKLEKQNNLPAGGMTKVLKERGIPVTTIKTQIKADILWLQVLQKNKGNLKPVSEADLKKRQAEMKKELAEPSFLIAEILLPKSANAEKIFEEIRQGGNFADMARTYSIAPSKAKDGLVGWIKKDHYSAQINAFLIKMEPGQLSRPIDQKNGTLLLFMLDKRQASKDGTIDIWDMAQMATPKGKTVALMPTILEQNSCTAFLNFAGKNGIPVSIKRGMINPSQLPAELRADIDKHTDGTVVGPNKLPEGDLFFMRCGVQKESLLPPADNIRADLEISKMEELSNKLLRDVKRYATIEYK